MTTLQRGKTCAHSLAPKRQSHPQRHPTTSPNPPQVPISNHDSTPLLTHSQSNITNTPRNSRIDPNHPHFQCRESKRPVQFLQAALHQVVTNNEHHELFCFHLCRYAIKLLLSSSFFQYGMTSDQIFSRMEHTPG